jgi:hypothetical protein
LYENICTLAVLPPKPVVAIALNTNIHNTFLGIKKRDFSCFLGGGDGVGLWVINWLVEMDCTNSNLFLPAGRCKK